MKKSEKSYVSACSLHVRKLTKLLLTLLLPILLVPENINAGSDSNVNRNVLAIQPIKVTGKVTDANSGEVLPGVNILIEGTNTGTTTDINGEFSINVPDATTTLLFSYIGYNSEKIEMNGQSTLNITLSPDIQKLDEVVVIGYGSQKQRDLTGAIATVKSDDIQRLPSTSMSEALQGLAPGVQVVNSDGKPGSSVNVRIRGIGTLGNATPLYVVDGYPVEDQAGYINPDDIASMSILKDASAIAIYGSRASNGVVMITTKRGSSDGMVVDFSSSWSNQFAPKKLEVMNAQQFAATAVEVGEANGVLDIPAAWYGLPANITSIDWQDEVFNNALRQDYSLSVRGGNDKTKAALSLGFVDHQGITYKSFYKRYNVGFNVDHKIGTRINVTSSLKYAFSNSETRISSGTNGIGNIIENIPLMDGNPLTTAVKDSEGNYGWYEYREPYKSSVNLIAQADENDFNNGNHNILGTLAAEVELLKGLKFKSNLGINIYSGFNWSFYPKMARGEDFRTEAQYTQRGDLNKEWLWENTLAYNKVIGNHTIDAVAGVSAQEMHRVFETVRGVGYASNDIRSLNGAALIDNTNGYEATYSIASTFGRLSYRLMNRYLLTATVRRDGSSRFNEGHRYGLFPSVGLGWVVSDEAFIQNVRFIDYLKLRGSWGQAGNQNIDAWQYQTNWSSGTTEWNEGYVLGAPQARINGIAVQNSPQKDLTWETTTSTNIGFEGFFLNNKVSVTFDYYNRTSEDFLLRIPLPSQSGFVNAVRNAGSIENKGIELALGYNDNTGDFKWSVNANLTTVSNKVVKLAEGVDNIDNTVSLTNPMGFVDYGAYQWVTCGRTEVGGEVGAFYGWVDDGIFQTQGEIDALNAAATAYNGGANSYFETAYTVPGDRRFKDLNNDDQITDADRKVLGSPIPEFYGGFNIAASYKSFDVSLFFFGSFGNKILNYQKKNLESMGRSGRTGVFSNASVDFMKNRWTGEGTSNTMTRGFLEDNNGNHRINSYFVEDGSYLRLKNIEIGYTLSDNIAQKLYLKRARVFISGQNLLTFTKYTGWDPEIGDYNGLLNSGVDVGMYPVAKSITAGLNLTF